MGKAKRKVKTKDKKQKPPRNKNKGPMWVVENDRVVRTRRSCPKCGPAVFLAIHYDRVHCGNCGFTDYPDKGNEQHGDKMRARRRRE
jgi:small subunit ribosomal protein S27Ae